MSNPPPLTPERVVTLLLEFNEALREADALYKAAIKVEADWYDKNVREKAKAWRAVRGRSREEREAYVNEMCHESLTKYKEAVNRSKYALEHQRNVRQQLSAIQSVNNNVREEMQFERTTP